MDHALEVDGDHVVAYGLFANPNPNPKPNPNPMLTLNQTQAQPQPQLQPSPPPRLTLTPTLNLTLGQVAYGLFAEHTLADLTQWRGEDGQVFF